MKKTLACVLAGSLLLAGCGQKNEAEVAALKAETEAVQTELDTEKARNETLHDQVAEFDGKLKDKQSEVDGLRLKLGESTDLQTENERLAGEIADLKAENEKLRNKPAVGDVEEPVVEEPTVVEPPKREPDPEVIQRLGDLLPLVKTGTDRDSLNEAVGLISRSDKSTRDDFIGKLETWVKDEPENKYARIALAQALTTRFQDLNGDMMAQATLAGQVQQEAKNALEIDPDYYDAVHLLAILKSNYPSFTPEFKGANVDLDKAIELQGKLGWEDRFVEIYVAYSRWYRVQSKLDEAADKVQAGLDYAPRNEELLTEQAAIEAARNSADEE